MIPEGRYTAQCIKAKTEMVGVETAKGTYAKTPKAVLIFRITDGQYQGKEIPMFLNVKYQRIPAGSKFYHCWVIANDCLKPKRKDRMSLEVFKNRIFSVGVKTVRPKFTDGKEKPQTFWYSRVNEIYEKVA